MPEEYEQYYNEGEEAYYEYKTPDDCQYTPHTFLWELWMMGYYNAKMDER